MKKYLFYRQEAIGTVLFKVRNLRKTRNLGQKFSNFCSNLLIGMAEFEFLAKFESSYLLFKLRYVVWKLDFDAKIGFGQIRTC